MRRVTCLLALANFLVGSALLAAHAQDRTLKVFAAASLQNALDDINAAYTARTGIKVAARYAASSLLAKQIDQGAHADIFASADIEWMTYAIRKKAINANMRVNLLGNQLVLIAPKESKISNVQIGDSFDLAKLAGDGRIAIGEVKSVPAGAYAKAALQKLGAWDAAAAKFAMAENVRAALALVARKEVSLGIVYETDAKVESNVKIVGYFPPDSYPVVIYPFAATLTAKPAAYGYLSIYTRPRPRKYLKSTALLFWSGLRHRRDVAKTTAPASSVTPAMKIAVSDLVISHPLRMERLNCLTASSTSTMRSPRTHYSSPTLTRGCWSN